MISVTNVVKLMDSLDGTGESCEKPCRVLSTDNCEMICGSHPSCITVGGFSLPIGVFQCCVHGVTSSSEFSWNDIHPLSFHCLHFHMILHLGNHHDCQRKPPPTQFRITTTFMMVIPIFPIFWNVAGSTHQGDVSRHWRSRRGISPIHNKSFWHFSYCLKRLTYNVPQIQNACFTFEHSKRKCHFRICLRPNVRMLSVYSSSTSLAVAMITEVDTTTLHLFLKYNKWVPLFSTGNPWEQRGTLILSHWYIPVIVTWQITVNAATAVWLVGAKMNKILCIQVGQM